MTKELKVLRAKFLPIIKRKGLRPQIRKFSEESFELIEALTEWAVDKYTSTIHDVSHTYDEEERAHIAEEMADCLVLLRQFQALFEIEQSELEDIVTAKVERTLKRMSHEDD